MAQPSIADMLKRLSAVPGVSGFEGPVRAGVTELLTPFADEVKVDGMGNLIALKRGQRSAEPRRRVMLAAHMDEIGLVVTGLEGEFLRFAPLNSADRRVLPGQEVHVHGRRLLPGVIATRPPHVLSSEERKQVLPLDKLFVDVGLTAQELSAQVRVGDVITFSVSPVELLGDRITGKALDNRVSVAAMVACLQQLTQMEHTWDVVAVATVQEERNSLGAMTGAFHLRPDLALIVDATFGRAPGVSASESSVLGAGPALSVGPNVHPLVYRRLSRLAEQLDIPHQVEPLPGSSGTDAVWIQVSRQGIPTGIISLPVRNMHTPVEVASVADVDRAAQLMAHFIAQLDESFLAELIPKVE